MAQASVRCLQAGRAADAGAHPPGNRRMKRCYLAATLASAALFAGLYDAAAWQPPRPRLVWNPSASAPIGLYAIDDAAPAVGDLILIAPPPSVAAWLARRGYVPAGTPLLKNAAALPGARVCRRNAGILIDGRRVAAARAVDRAGRVLPRWTGCRTLRGGEIFLLNAAPDSLDGRYFGPLPASGLIGRARPILTRDAPGAPLRWRPRPMSFSLHCAAKEQPAC